MNRIKIWLSLSLILLLSMSFSPAWAANTTAVADFPQQEEGEDGEGEGEDGPLTSDAELVEVVVAKVSIPPGERIRSDLVSIELRPGDNIAIRAGVTFSSIEQVEGEIARTTIPAGKEILVDMIALSPADLDQRGSDLALHIQDGRVAIAFPINQYIGAAYAMRPGDFVDALMSFNLLEYDLEFQTPLPNVTSLVDEEALELGAEFLLPAVTQGRLELVPEVDRVAEITPREIVPESTGAGSAESIVTQISRRVTQLTLQQLEVLWVGTWRSSFNDGWVGPNNPAFEARSDLAELSPAQREELLNTYGIDARTVGILEGIVSNRRELIAPDMVILSMTLQDALALKWAYEEPGIDIDLVLRAQGDNALFATTSVSLPQLVEQAGLEIPEPNQFGLEPYIGSASIPRLPEFNTYSGTVISNGPQ